MAITISRERDDSIVPFFEKLLHFMQVTGDKESCEVAALRNDTEIFISPQSYQRGDTWVRITADGEVEIGTPGV